MGGIDPLIRRLPPLPSFFSPPSLYPLSRSFTLPCFPTRSNRLFFLPHLSPLNLSFTQCSPSLSIPFNFILLTPFPTYSSSISPTLFPSSFPSLSCHFLILSCINPCPFPSTCICISPLPHASRCPLLLPYPIPSPLIFPYPLPLPSHFIIPSTLSSFFPIPSASPYLRPILPLPYPSSLPSSPTPSPSYPTPSITLSYHPPFSHLLYLLPFPRPSPSPAPSPLSPCTVNQVDGRAAREARIALLKRGSQSRHVLLMASSPSTRR